MATGRPRKDPRDPVLIMRDAGLEPLEPCPRVIAARHLLPCDAQGRAWCGARPCAHPRLWAQGRCHTWVDSPLQS